MFKRSVFTMLFVLALLLVAVPVALAQDGETPEDPFEPVLTISGVVEAVDADARAVTIDGVVYQICLDLDPALFLVGETVSVNLMINDNGTMVILSFAVPDDGEDPADDPADDPSDDPVDVTVRDNHPVGVTIAEGLDVAYDDVMALYLDGIGFGEIARAYAVAAEAGVDVAEVLAQRIDEGLDWCVILAEYGLTPNDFTPGSVISGNKSDIAPQPASDPVEEPLRQETQDQVQQSIDNGQGNMAHNAEENGQNQQQSGRN